MKKLIAIALLSVATSFAVASDLSLNYAAVPYSEATVPAVATETETPTSSPSALEAGAAKVGAFFGGLVKAPVDMGKAFVKGVRQGYTNQPAEKATAPTEPSQAAESEKPSTLGLLNPVALVAKLAKRSKDTELAPVEEKSTIAANTGY